MQPTPVCRPSHRFASTCLSVRPNMLVYAQSQPEFLFCRLLSPPRCPLNLVVRPGFCGASELGAHPATRGAVGHGRLRFITHSCSRFYVQDLERENAHYRPKFLNPTDSPRSRMQPTPSLINSPRSRSLHVSDVESLQTQLEVSLKVQSNQPTHKSGLNAIKRSLYLSSFFRD